jgi:hypothetical protein
LSNVWKKAAWMLMLSALLLIGCVVEEDVPTDSLFPPQVGAFLRTSGPGPDAETGVDKATYGGTNDALGELPPNATSVGYDPALGQRSGVFFSFGDEYHAAWGNGDWVFVLSAPSEIDRLTFLNAYGY